MQAEQIENAPNFVFYPDLKRVIRCVEPNYTRLSMQVSTYKHF